MKRRIILSIISIAVLVGALIVGVPFTDVKASGQVPSGIYQQRQYAQSNDEQEVASTIVRTQPYSQTSSAQLPASPTYAALGDSVAAGAGLSSLTPAMSLDETCDRSAEAYPYKVAAALQTDVVQLACSGAKVDEGIYGRQTRARIKIPAQLDAAYANSKPDLITATIGANDVRWLQLIRQCYAIRCGTRFDDVRAKIYRADLRVELTRMFYEINARSAGDPPRVLISGYYMPFSTLDCLATNRVTPTEVAWLEGQTASLNQAIKSVTPLFSFVEFVSIDFTGHDVCSNDPWVQGVDAAAPFHPTNAGQTAIANAYITSLGR